MVEQIKWIIENSGGHVVSNGKNRINGIIVGIGNNKNGNN